MQLGLVRETLFLLFPIYIGLILSPNSTFSETTRTSTVASGKQLNTKMRIPAKVKTVLTRISNANALQEVIQAYNMADLTDQENEHLRQELNKQTYVKKIDFLSTQLLKKLNKASLLSSEYTVQSKLEAIDKANQSEAAQQNKYIQKRFDQLSKEEQSTPQNALKKEESVWISSVDPGAIGPDQLFIIRGEGFFVEPGIVRLSMHSEEREITLEIENWSNHMILSRFPSEIRPFFQGLASLYVKNDNGKASNPFEIEIIPLKATEMISQQVSVRVDPVSGVSSHHLWKGKVLQNDWQLVGISIANVEFFSGASQAQGWKPSIWFTKKPSLGSADLATSIKISAPPKVLPFEQTLVTFFVHAMIQGPTGFDYQ